MARRRPREPRETRSAEPVRARSASPRTLIVGAVAAAVLIAVGVVLGVVLSGGSDSSSGGETTQTRLAEAGAVGTLFAGVDQEENALGKESAPVTLVEYVDLQCPFCQRFSQDGLPDLVKEYVKTGQAKIVLRTLTFIGPDSERGARVAWGAADQNLMFQFVENFYANQGEENTGYADEAFLKKVAGGVDGLDVTKALDGRDSAKVTSSIQASQSAATKANIDSTPSFLVGPTDGQLSKIETRTLTIDDFREPVKDALAEAKNT